MQLTPLFAVLATILVASANAATFDVEAGDDMPDTVQMSMLLPAMKIQQQPAVRRLLGLSWNDCGGPGAWVKIKSVSVQPDPIKLNGKITIAFAYTATHSFGDAEPLSAVVVVKKRIFGSWMKLPCIDNIGSCSYGNLCTARPPPPTCPAEFVKAKVPCKCPFPAGNFTMPGYTFSVDASKIPSFLESGQYQAAVNVNAGSAQVLCAIAELTLA